MVQPGSAISSAGHTHIIKSVTGAKGHRCCRCQIYELFQMLGLDFVEGWVKVSAPSAPSIRGKVCVPSPQEEGDVRWEECGIWGDDIAFAAFRANLHVRGSKSFDRNEKDGKVVAKFEPRPLSDDTRTLHCASLPGRSHCKANRTEARHTC